jgi:hypothetical protein
MVAVRVEVSSKDSFPQTAMSPDTIAAHVYLACSVGGSNTRSIGALEGASSYDVVGMLAKILEVDILGGQFRYGAGEGEFERRLSSLVQVVVAWLVVVRPGWNGQCALYFAVFVGTTIPSTRPREGVAWLREGRQTITLSSLRG